LKSRRFQRTGSALAASDHELDAATGALVGDLFLRGEAEVYGNFAEGAIVMPKDAGKLRENKK
jgi:predicted RNase H-like nuclease